MTQGDLSLGKLSLSKFSFSKLLVSKISRGKMSLYYHSPYMVANGELSRGDLSGYRTADILVKISICLLHDFFLKSCDGRTTATMHRQPCSLDRNS